MKTTIEHKYNIGDKHFDFNRDPDKENTFIFYISGITNVNNKVFYELSDVKGNKENIQSYHFGRWLIAEEDIIPNFEKYVVKRKKLLNKLVNDSSNNLLKKSEKMPIYKDDIKNYYAYTVELIDKIIPGIFDKMLESELKEVKRIKSTDYYRVAKIFSWTSIVLFTISIILLVLLIIK